MARPRGEVAFAGGARRSRFIEFIARTRARARGRRPGGDPRRDDRPGPGRAPGRRGPRVIRVELPSPGDTRGG